KIFSRSLQDQPGLTFKGHQLTNHWRQNLIRAKSRRPESVSASEFRRNSMKVCPKCSQSFADGFAYCPKDAARLQKYDLRARIRRDDEFHFLIESESLIARLKRELVGAFGELRVNPRAFLRGLLRGEGITRQRKRLLGAGFASGLLVYASVFVAVTLVSLLNLSMPESGVVGLFDPATLNDVRLLFPTIRTKTEKDQAKSGAGSLGGSLRHLQDPGGGGGANDQKRTSRGVPPLPSLDQQLAQPSPEPPVIEHSMLIIKPTVYADPKSFPPMNGRVGVLDSPPDAPPSRGSGSGSGIGSGKGPGYREGDGGNVGGHNNRDGGGTYSGCCDGIPVMGPELRPTI